MALDDTQVIIPGTGYVFLNETVAAAPPGDTTAEINALDLTSATLATGWANLGHTAREDNVSLGKDGGDVSTVGTWQTSALRTTVDPITYTLAINALQVSNETLTLYFGGGNDAGTDVFDQPDTPTAIDRALFLVMVDGSTRLGVYVPKVSVIGSDAIEVDPADFLQFNLTCTFVKSGSNPMARWFHPALGV
jgi:hypothetical protein